MKINAGSIMAAFISSLSCFLPVILVLLGVVSASYGLYIGNILFYDFWFLFLGFGVSLVFAFSYFYVKQKNKVCGLNILKDSYFKKIFFQNVLIFLVFYFIFEVAWEFFWIKLGFYK